MQGIRRIHVVALMVIATGSAANAASTTSMRVGLNVPLTDVRAAIEAAVPQKIERLGATEFDGNWGFRYGAWRGPISVTGLGRSLQIATRVEFAVKVCRNVPRLFGGSFCQWFASCGYGNDRLASVDIRIDVTGAWTSSWSIASSVTTVVTVDRPCRMTILGIDVTARAVGLLRSRIEAEAGKLADRLQLRAVAERAWSEVKPVGIGGDQWIAARADRVSVGAIAFQPLAITCDAVIDVELPIVTSSTPPPMAPLPPSLVIGVLPSSTPGP